MIRPRWTPSAAPAASPPGTLHVESRLYRPALAFGAMAIGLVHVARYWGWPATALAYGSAALLGFPLVSAVMRRSGFRGDHLLLPLVCALTALGLTEIYRLQPELMLRQATWIYLGFAALLCTFHLARDASHLARYRYVSALLGIVLLLVTFVLAPERGGTRQWIIIGPFSTQPSEIVKVLIVLFFASYLAEHAPLLAQRGLPRRLQLRVLGPIAAVFAFSVLLLAVQRDLGAAMLYFAVVLIMVYAATGRADYTIAGVAAFVTAAAACYAVVPHVRLRVDVWMNPWRDFSASGYQIAQSLFAFGSGGLTGSGPGFGHPNLVPAAHTDLIFAAIGEELGYLGAAATILLFMLLIIRALQIGLRATTDFARLLAVGAAAVLGMQAFMILGGSLRLVPLTGITLPFVSYGGSSIVSNFVLLGLLLAISDGAGCGTPHS